MDDMRTPLSVRIGFLFRKIRDRIRFFINSRRPDEKVKWRTVKGGKQIPCCPRCGEYVYYATQCTRCGQRFMKNTVTIGQVLDSGR